MAGTREAAGRGAWRNSFSLGGRLRYTVSFAETDMPLIRSQRISRYLPELTYLAVLCPSEDPPELIPDVVAVDY